ncbi:protein adenylyltransferase Fic [Adelges cooleyi]|uniref:protein adenylyltransferase Fic n=1 Tax=Adelges cooleyi TaxID=133065 RepID=UPI00218094AD|nr:protein adenylyltransferase Fic [Adelges cooleyi]
MKWLALLQPYRFVKSYLVLIVFLIGVLCCILLPIFWPFVLHDHSEHKDLIVRRPFSIVDFDYHELVDTGKEVHELIIRESTVDVVSDQDNVEALISLIAANEMKLEGKTQKAMKLIEHGIALSPRNPDLLNGYGEIIEELQKDVVKADQMYFQALVHSPKHKGALRNRKRTELIVDDLDWQQLKRIDEKRDKVASISESNSALRRAKKEAYFQHIYHTVGIEGNRMSLSETRSILETRMAIGGRSLAEHNEIIGLEAALKYINATLINQFGRIAVDDILEIHKRVMAFVDPFESGVFRHTQVFVGGHIPPGPSHILALMENFSKWLNSDTALRLHPVRYAALAHYKLVHIHPFTDGNGRTSRLLMNMILMQAGYPPVIIPKGERHKYYRNLDLANKGDIRPFMRFIAECTEKTLNQFLLSTSTEFTTDIPELDYDNIILN